MDAGAPPEHNVTGIDYRERGHFRRSGPPIIDFHAHVMRTRPPEAAEGGTSPADGADPLAQARTMLAVAEEFGVGRVVSMCPPEDIPALRQEFGGRIAFN